MILGVVITDYAIACSWGLMLIHLCDLWLILSAIGYLISGWMVRSRAFFLAAIIHGVTTLILPWFSGWQFAITGIVMMSNLLIFSEKQWDMLLPRELEQYSSLKERNFFSFSSPGFFFDHSIRLVHKFSKALLTSLAGSRLLLFSKFLLILKIKPL